MIQRAVKFGTRRFGNEIHPLVLPLRRPRVRRDLGSHARVCPPGWGGRSERCSMAATSFAPDGAAGRTASRAGASPRSIASTTRIDRFFAAAGEPWDLIVERSRAHLDWRYCDDRGGTFRKLIARGRRRRDPGLRRRRRARTSTASWSTCSPCPAGSTCLADLVEPLIADLEPRRLRRRAVLAAASASLSRGARIAPGSSTPASCRSSRFVPAAPILPSSTS